MIMKEFEKKLFKQGRIFLYDDDIKDQEIHFVWYSINGEKRVLSSSFSFAKEGAKLKFDNLEKMINSGKFPECKRGIGVLKGNLSNFSFKELDKKEDVLEKYGMLTKSVTPYIKTKIPQDNEIWKYLCTKEFVVVDTETTGIKNTDEVVELAAVKVKDFVIVDEFQEYINPTIPISPAAQAVHGLSKSFLVKNGKPAEKVFKDFKKFLGDFSVSGYNVSFDKRKIERHAAKVNLNVPVPIAFDVLAISRKFMQMPDHKLANIVDRLNLRKGLKSHSALDDVIATLRYIVILRQVYDKANKPSVSLF